jgi:hypothetical protein
MPLPPGRNETDIWLPSTLALPVSTRCPPGVGDGDGAESRLQLLGKPERHRTRRCRDLVADARFGMVEHGVRRSPSCGEEQQERDWPDQR